MLWINIGLWIGLLVCLLPALLKKSRFRGYMIPARVFYDLLLAEVIWISMRAWYASSLLTIMIIVIFLFLIGLLETSFRNKLQNKLSNKLMVTISITFVLALLANCLLMMLAMK